MPPIDAATRPWTLIFGKEPASRGAWVARVSVLYYASVLPFTHNAALKSLGLVGMLIALALTAAEGRLRLDLRSPILRSLAAVMSLALLSTLLGSTVADDLDAYRKHFLPLLLLVPLIVIHFRRWPALLALLSVLVAAFSVRTALALYEMLTTTREEGLFFKGYAMEATLYMPLAAGLLAVTAGRWRYAVGAAVLLGSVAAVVNESRTAVVAIALGCLAVPLVLGRRRQALLLIAAGALVVMAVLFARPQLVARYGQALEASTYSGPTGLSLRYPIWIGVWQVAMQRPVLGHGFGWKKLGRTAVDQGFVERWKASADPYLQGAAWYFALPTDKVNPHNLALELLFEMGFVGLAAYAAMMAVLFWRAFALTRAPPPWGGLAATVVGFLVSYAVMNLSNGLWLGAGPSTIVVALLEVARLANRETA